MITYIINLINVNKDKEKWISTNLKQELENLQTITLYGLPMLITFYPISDKIHFLIGSTIVILATLYLIYIILKWLFNKITVEKKLFVYKTGTLLIWLFITCIITKYVYINLQEYTKLYKNHNINNDIAHYNYIEIPEYLEQRIQEMDDFIKDMDNQNKKVYIFDAEAAIYNIPLNKYNKNYDMFLKGNLGKDGEDGIIKELEEEKINNRVQLEENNENVKTNEKIEKIYLVKKPEYRLNWQTPNKVIEFIRENFKKIGEVSIYAIYIATE